MIEELKNTARELLKNKKVDIIIGYTRASDGVSARPCFIDKEEEVDNLIWDAYCQYNLSNYHKDFAGKRIGLVAKACEARSIIVLLQEHQLKRENIFIIGMECSGIIDEKRSGPMDQETQEIGFAAKCKNCQPARPMLYDVLIKDKEKKQKASGLEEDPYDSILKLEAKSLEERFKMWQEEFSRCIRCYACRQVCPMCYCPKCVADQIQPSWFSRAANVKGNFSWNITRAMHLAGRCIDCGECERACPVGITLRDINKKIEKDVKELFGYEAGSSPDQKPLLSAFDKNDPEDFIR